MSLSNILNRGNSAPPDVLLYCSGLRCSETCQSKNLLVSNESTMLGPLSVFGLQHDYGDMIVDGTLTAGTFNVNNITANNITCQSISGVTGSFSGPVTAASVNAPAVTGTNSSFSGVAVSGSIITSNITTGGINVSNSANITNDLTVGGTGSINNITGFTCSYSDINCQTFYGNTGSCTDLNVTNVNNSNIINANNIYCDGAVNCQTFNASQMAILPDLDTATRDSLPQQEASILYNNETRTPQIYGDSLWNNISYWPNVASYFLVNDESVPVNTIHKIGSVNDMQKIFVSGSDYFEYSTLGDFKILKSGIYNFSCCISLQPPASSFTSLQLYLGVANSGLTYYNINGLTDNVGPYQFANKEQKMSVSATFYVDAGEVISFYLYQNNDTGNSFTINNSTYYPFPINYNNIFDVKFISPHF